MQFPYYKTVRGEIIEYWPQPATPEQRAAMQKELTFWVPMLLGPLGFGKLALALGVVGNNWDDFEGTFDVGGAVKDIAINRVVSLFKLPPVVGDFVEEGISRIIDWFTKQFDDTPCGQE